MASDAAVLSDIPAHYGTSAAQAHALWSIVCILQLGATQRLVSAAAEDSECTWRHDREKQSAARTRTMGRDFFGKPARVEGHGACFCTQAARSVGARPRCLVPDPRRDPAISLLDLPSAPLPSALGTEPVARCCTSALSPDPPACQGERPQAIQVCSGAAQCCLKVADQDLSALSAIRLRVSTLPHVRQSVESSMNFESHARQRDLHPSNAFGN